MTSKVQAIITKKIIDGLKQGNIAWDRGYKLELPRNFITKHEYTGINRLLCWINDYKHQQYLTYNQASKLGKVIRPEELKKSSIVTFTATKYLINGKYTDYKKLTKAQRKEAKKIFIFRFYRVWNIEQTTLPLPKIGNNKNGVIKNCEDLVKNYKNPPAIKTAQGMPSYSPLTDIVSMPDLKQYDTSERYYKTLFHELIHSTGHKKRLDRFTGQNALHNSNDYSFEELIAEIGASFLSHKTGITTKDTEKNTQAYINGWIKKLGSNPEWITKASSRSEKAVSHIAL